MLLRYLDALSLDALENLGSFGGKFAGGADAATIYPEQEWERKASHSEESRDRASPLVAQVIVHVGGEERKNGAKQRPNDRVGGQHGSGEDDI